MKMDRSRIAELRRKRTFLPFLRSPLRDRPWLPLIFVSAGETSCPLQKPEQFALTGVLAMAGSSRMPQSEVESTSRSVPPRILVVEDEALIRFAMAEALRDLGASVVEAASADEAWQYLTAGGSVDLVFTDYRMPGSMTGGQLATRIRREYPSLVVIVTSGYFDDPTWSEPLPSKALQPLRNRDHAG
jgi:CheY-like chemotaxis protein